MPAPRVSRGFVHNELDRCYASVVGRVVPIANADQPIAESLNQFLGTSLARVQRDSDFYGASLIYCSYNQ